MFRRTSVSLIFFLIFLSVSCSISCQQRTVEIPMSDGVKLKAELWLPSALGSYPVLLERTPYNRRDVIKMHKHLVDSGYAVLVQNLRGIGGSEGSWEVFGNDSWGGPGRQDGIDTVNWIKKRRWCNGKIGLLGFSASAISAQLLLSAEPEGVQCAYLVAGSDNFYESIFPYGCYRKNTIEEWPPAREYLPEIIKHPSYDEFWERRDARARADRVKVPVYIVGGWYDLFQRSSTEFFRLLNTNASSPTYGKCKLVMQALSHAATPGELVIEDRQKINIDEKMGSMKDWFDYWLKGVDNGLYVKPSVALFVV
ncbi:MAG: CocE/NonD family hydrolase, partial [Candidatus Hydrogenedens sp.]|nr:CocE/NonD family hydrolase [Candidatus Hydrogenedens sp.]